MANEEKVAEEETKEEPGPMKECMQKTMSKLKSFSADVNKWKHRFNGSQSDKKKAQE